jgi:hypothetical protein
MVPLLMVLEIIEMFSLALSAITAKWILVGKITEGRHPVFGSFYWRWLLTQSITDAATAMFLEFFGGTVLFNIWIRCLGGTVGSRTSIDSNVFSPDLVTIGYDTVIEEHSTIDGVISNCH